MDGHETGVMVALLPITDDWCRQELPHMTLVYAGTTDTLAASLQNTLAKAASDLAVMNQPITLAVLGKEVFGEGTEDAPRVDVFLLRPSPALLAMRAQVEDFNASQHPFRPHATIGPEGTFLEFEPRYIAFDRVCLQWGSQQLIFSMRGGLG